MIKASEDTVMAMFEKVHGSPGGNCYAEVVHSEECDVVGVALMKDGEECWRATLSELAFDLLAQQFEDRRVGELLGE